MSAADWRDMAKLTGMLGVATVAASIIVAVCVGLAWCVAWVFGVQ